MISRAPLLLLLAGLLAGLLAACDSPAPTGLEEQPAARPPAELCKAIKDGLDKLSAAGGAIMGEKAEATVEQQVWFAMAESDRGRLAQLLAFHDACREPAKEKEVTVRSETGMVLLRQVVDTSLSPTGLLGADDGS